MTDSEVLPIPDHADALQQEALALLGSLLARLRAAGARADDALRELARQLARDPQQRAAARGALLALLGERRAVLLFANSGIYPETGVLSETYRRISHRLLPEAPDALQFQGVLQQLFRRGDADWLAVTGSADWAALIRALRFAEAGDGTLTGLYDDLLEALRVVSHRIAASGLEPEMLRLHPDLELHQSPFLAQCEEALALAGRIEQARLAGAPLAEDERHLLVLLDQCRASIALVRRRAQQQGASFHLTFRLRRLQQYLQRAVQLSVLAASLCQAEEDAAIESCAALCLELALAECRRNDLVPFWRQNLELVALRVSENAGRAGEHYISETRSEYFGLLRSALGGGLVIACMAANKLWLGSLHLPPLTEILAFCLNYALGFVLIHILHFSVATKQPAMTANAIAAAIDESGGRERDMEPLAALVARTMRSQLAAIVGNVSLAIPCAMLIALAVQLVAGEHFVAPDKAYQLLQDTDPLGSGALIYAGIAGACLFLAGLISGYYDNLCAYNRIPQRLLLLGWPRRMFGAARWQRFAAYVENNLGALVGNFAFGFLLGGASGLGYLLGLPLDIRHIAFSSAYWGYALVGLEFSPPWALAGLAAAGVLAIGLTNLLVSFYLALWVGLKARGVTFSQRRSLARAIVRRLRQNPREFLLPPGRG